MLNSTIIAPALEADLIAVSLIAPLADTASEKETIAVPKAASLSPNSFISFSPVKNCKSPPVLGRVLLNSTITAPALAAA